MLRVVRKVMGHHHPDVDDVTQDAVVALLGSLETFRAPAASSTSRGASPSRPRSARGGGPRCASARPRPTGRRSTSSRRRASPLATTVASRRLRTADMC